MMYYLPITDAIGKRQIGISVQGGIIKRLDPFRQSYSIKRNK